MSDMELDLLVVKRKVGFNIIARSDAGKKYIKKNFVTFSSETVFINGDASDLAEVVDKIHASDLIVEVA